MNPEDLKVLLFDLGGTLMYERDPWPPIFARAEQALQQTLRSRGFPLDPDSYAPAVSFLNFYNDRRAGRVEPEEETSFDLLKLLLGRNGYQGVPEDAIRAALRAMYEVTQANWIPEHDALPALQALRAAGYRLGLISNAADDENTQILIDKGGFRPHLEFILSSAACGMRKPDARIFQPALDFFRTPPSQTAMIGDSLEADIAGGNRIGMYTIWIARRAPASGGAAARIPPAARVDSLAEIPALLAKRG